MSDPQTGLPQTPAPDKVAGGVRRGGTIAGVILVVLGTAMLFGRYVPWGDLLRFWPLIIVIGGVAQVFRSHGEAPMKRVAEGLGSIAVGFVLLCNTFGYLPWTIWVTMLALWPLLLVALGVELLGKGLGLTWVRALSNVILILGLLYGAFVLQPGTLGIGMSILGPKGAAAQYSASVPHESGIREGSASVQSGTARLTIRAGSDLARVGGNAPWNSKPELKSSVTSGVADISVDEPSRRTFVFGVQDRTIDLWLDGAVLWKQLRLDVGAVQADADLRELQVEKVTMNIGASDLLVTLGKRSPAVAVDIASGAANVTLRVPAGAGVTIESKSGLSNVNVPPGFSRVSGMPVVGESSWTSGGTGSPRISVVMQSGVSNLNIETY